MTLKVKWQRFREKLQLNQWTSRSSTVESVVTACSFFLEINTTSMTMQVWILNPLCFENAFSVQFWFYSNGGKTALQLFFGSIAAFLMPSFWIIQSLLFILISSDFRIFYFFFFFFKIFSSLNSFSGVQCLEMVWSKHVSTLSQKLNM